MTMKLDLSWCLSNPNKLLHWTAFMFKTRYLSMLRVLLIVLGIIVLVGFDWYRAYSACSDKLSSRYLTSERQYQYQFTRFYPPPLVVAFDDGKVEVWCTVRRNGLQWKVNAITEAWPYP
jgi:hypothetical protein